MSRPIVSYSDLPGRTSYNSPSSSAGHQSKPPHHQSRFSPNTNHSGSFNEHHGRMSGGGKRKRSRKFQESPRNVHWDAQASRTEGGIQVTYGDTGDYEDQHQEGGSGPSVSGLGTTKDASHRGQQGVEQPQRRPQKVPRLSKAEETPNLSIEQAWDDSALVDAWDAAMEEYRILNGPEKDWKTEPVHKNSVWYQSSSSGVGEWVDQSEENAVDAGEAEEEEWEEANGDEEEVLEELSIDPSTQSTPITELAPGTTPAITGMENLSPQEVFQKAVEASYWAGYWAGAYHNMAVKKAPAALSEKTSQDTEKEAEK